MPVVVLTDPKELLTEIESVDDVLIDFYAEWCGPCMRGAPFFESYSNKHPNIKFIKFNIDNLDDDEKYAYDIKTIPLLKRYKKGNHIKSIQGLKPETLTSILAD